MEWVRRSRQKAVNLFVFIKVTKAISPQPLFGFWPRTEGKLVKYAARISQEVHNKNAVRHILDQCPVLLQKVNNLHPVIARSDFQAIVFFLHLYHSSQFLA